jgi:hypothetical protein
MAKNKYVVTTAYGTFKRNTDRTYSHFVIWQGVDPRYIAERALESLASAHKYFQRYAEACTLAEQNPGFRVEIEDGCSYNSAQWLKDNRKPAGTLRLIKDTGEQYQKGFLASDYALWRDEADADIKGHDAALKEELEANAAAPYAVAGWCGRLDLALSLATQQLKYGRQHIRVISIATGCEI